MKFIHQIVKMKFILLFITFFICNLNVISAQNINGNSIPGRRSEEQNHKPLFEKCSEYSPFVMEQQPHGTHVITVQAQDSDPSDTPNGQITYTVLGEKKNQAANFIIPDNRTGEVVTNAVFDRDEPNRQKELYVSIQATDHGVPPLADICTFKVTITDINDNAPILDQETYRVSIAEDLPEKSEVVRVSAYDYDDGENSRLTYILDETNTRFNEYFRIDSSSGVIYLKKSLGLKHDDFHSTVTVQDNGEIPNRVTAEIIVSVVESNKKPPTVVPERNEISIKEDFADFEMPLIRITAVSNAEDPEVTFSLVEGKTAQTNNKNDFILYHGNNTAAIKIARRLDYESVTEYQLQVRAQNKESLSTTVNIVIKIEDVNDEIPIFIESLRGSVVENGESGVQAMTVRAIDKDGTRPNSDVFYELTDHQDSFEIDRNTGVITTKVQFDRENTSSYFVYVMAYDGAPSALLKDKSRPNQAFKSFEIVIEDQNDNPPHFKKSVYVAENIKETSDIGQIVVEVKAEDKDTAAQIVYSIIEGDPNNDFSIEEKTGRIKTAKKLDFEKIESYNLTVMAFDGAFNDTAKVYVHILNENDERPQFEPYNKDISFEEEKISRSDECIITLSARDPDIKDPNENQNIVYDVINKDQIDFLAVSKTGCVTIKKALDRDPPTGHPSYQGFIRARDNNGIPESLDTHAEINITLIDINDNAPILNITEVVWYENQPGGEIVKLTAIDFDTVENGPPFTYELLDTIDDKFRITNDILYAEKPFDREEQKFYELKIRISDSGQPRMSGISTLRVIIGDRNDNIAKDGSSEIFVYKYEKLQDEIEIGRVYVDDPDDWDLPDKIFVANEIFSDFSITKDGMIKMKPSVEPSIYKLTFRVTEEHYPDIQKHTVNADVTVTVKEIPEEAVLNSGSVRLIGLTKEAFIENDEKTMTNKRDLLRDKLAAMFNISNDNVDVMTVLNPPGNNSVVDVRFSAHSSPYYKSERLNNRITYHQDELEQDLDAKFYMINVNECFENTKCADECHNRLQVDNTPAVVFTNKTSFVGVEAYSVAECTCNALPGGLHCLNGGSPVEDAACNCPEGMEGPNCESLCVSFNGNGWAHYPTFDVCNTTDISLHVLTQQQSGLIFYAGPLTPRQAEVSKDFISLELNDGNLVLKLDQGHGTMEIPYDKKKIVDGARHKIRLKLTRKELEISVDDCSSECLLWTEFKSEGVLNLNGPLQLGGRGNYFPEEEAKRIWNITPTYIGFVGLISNFTYNNELLNLGFPSDKHPSVIPSCSFGVAQAVTFGIDSNFLVAILVCIAILLILLLAVVVQKRKQDNQHEKDMDDTRENIINYEDEGGGEYDTNFDLSVLRGGKFDEKPVMDSNTDDISKFLDNKKHACDKDNLPYDDVRHYGYEGDGNTSGSLSSLASDTDDTDCDMNYLSSFGPRFRKLADMYGDDASEEESPNGDGESWC